MKRFWVIRFAKGVIQTQLYFSPLDGQLAFTTDIMKSFGFGSKEDAEACRAEILSQIKDSDLKRKLTEHMTVEEHCLGDALN